MLIPTSLHEILADNLISGFDIEEKALRKKAHDVKEEIIRDIIVSNINIQLSLVELRSDTENTVSILGFSTDENFLEQAERLKYIFSTVIILSYKDEPIACSVSNPLQKAFIVFQQLKEENQLNKWLHYFVLRPYVEDVQVQGGYEYVIDENNTDVDDLETFEEDVFFQYIGHNKRDLVVNSFVDVSGFTLDELNEDPYIKALSKRGKKIYIHIFKDEVKSKRKFIKFMKLTD